MPYCMRCRASFRGPGRYCGRHGINEGRDRRYPYNAYEHFNYNSDSTDPAGGHMRSRQRDPPSRMRFADEHGGQDMYESNDNYASRGDHNLGGRHDRRTGVIRYGHGDFNVDTSLHQPLVYTFNTLSRAHAIRSMTYNVSPLGDRSVTAEANMEREMCHICKHWFPDHERLEYHQQEFSAGCEEHRKCMRPEDAMYHASREKHDRCFVRGCYSAFRREGDWRASAIVEHIGKYHYY